MDISIERYGPKLQPSWDDFVAASKNGTFLFKRPYMDYHADRFEDISLICRAKDQIVALLPANIDGTNVHSHQGLSYGGFVTGPRMSAPLMRDVCAAVLDRLRAEGAEALVYKCIPHIYHRQPAEEDLFALFRMGAKLCRRDVLSVIGDRDSARIQERRRRGARRATKAGLDITESQDVAAFWPILEQRLQRAHGVRPTHSADEMALLMNRFPAEIRLFVCGRDGEAMGGAVIFATDTVAHVQYMAASDAGLAAGALDFLLLHLLGTVFRDKRFFDFGGSNDPESGDLNLGLIEQKEGFGARSIVQDHYRLSLAA